MFQNEEKQSERSLLLLLTMLTPPPSRTPLTPPFRHLLLLQALTYSANASKLASNPLSKDVNCEELNETALDIAKEVSRTKVSRRLPKTMRRPNFFMGWWTLANYISRHLSVSIIEFCFELHKELPKTG